MKRHVSTRGGIGFVLAIALIAAIIGGSRLGLAQTWTHERIDNWETWYLDGDDRLRYNYDDGQWWNIGEYGDWQTLSATGLTSDFIADGGLHDLGNGFSIAYDSSRDLAFFKEGDYWRLFYSYDAGQWYSIGWGTGGSFGGWSTPSTSGQSAEFLGWTGWHSLGTGWDFSYDTALDIGYYRTATYERFAYKYLSGAWMQHGPSDDWSEFSGTGMNARFIADGCLFDLLNGWTFGYDTSRGRGFFRNDTLAGGLSAWRFMYQYSAGRWYHMGDNGQWNLLGNSNLSADFLGDGTVRTLGNNLYYLYKSDDTGEWYRGASDGPIRFSYDYDGGQWRHYYNSVGFDLGPSASSSLFLADGGIHDLGNGFSYQYGNSLDVGYWLVSGAKRFHYVYGAGQWFHYGPVDTTGQQLSGTGTSLRFLATYTSTDRLALGNGFDYYYSSGIGYWLVSGANRFHYVYGDGQWFHYGPSDTTGRQLSSTGKSARFVATYTATDRLALGNGFEYYYSYRAGDYYGWWLLGDSNRFLYEYGRGEWHMWHHALNKWQQLSRTDASATAEFVGDGSVHRFGSDCYWNMQYTGDTVLINVWTDTDTTQRNYLRYAYGTGSSGWWEDTNAGSYGWRQMTGYWLSYAQESNLSFYKEAAMFLYMDLYFGDSHYNGKDILATYREQSVEGGGIGGFSGESRTYNGTDPHYTWYHDYLTTWWYENTVPYDPPVWAAVDQGATDAHRP